jgi:Uma2 family endonuclease
VDEYYRMAEVGLLAPDARVELIEGAIIDMAPIGERHIAAVIHLTHRLVEAVGKQALISVQGAVRLGIHDQPQPDFAVLRPSADNYRQHVPAPADVLLLIEVSDTTLAFDRGAKAALYARHGIGEYWVVDVERGVLHELREPKDGRYLSERTVTPGRIAIPGLGIEVDLSDTL